MRKYYLNNKHMISVKKKIKKINKLRPISLQTYFQIVC